MGTRSTTKIYQLWIDEKQKKHRDFILGLYKQYDGGTESWGKDLKDFISSGVFVNGISEGKQGDKKYQFNGIGDFALMLVNEFKDGTGGLYATSESDSQQYNYVIEFEQNYQTGEATLKIECEEEKSFKQTFVIKVK